MAVSTDNKTSAVRWNPVGRARRWLGHIATTLELFEGAVESVGCLIGVGAGLLAAFSWLAYQFIF